MPSWQAPERPLAREYLFGDDAESDAEAFSLYAGLVHERCVWRGRDRIADAGMREDNQRCALALLDRLPEKRGKVEKVFIHLGGGTPPEQYERFESLVAPVGAAFSSAWPSSPSVSSTRTPSASAGRQSPRRRAHLTPNSMHSLPMRSTAA